MTSNQDVTGRQPPTPLQCLSESLEKGEEQCGFAKKGDHVTFVEGGKTAQQLWGSRCHAAWEAGKQDVAAMQTLS